MTADDIAWIGTAFPLLAWVDGRSWASDPAVDLYGETAASEDFRLADLTVVAGRGRRSSASAPRRACTRRGGAHCAPVHRRRRAGRRGLGRRLRRRHPAGWRGDCARRHPRAGSRTSGGTWPDEIATQVGDLSTLLGRYPNTDLWATIVPPQSDGVEFPTALQFGDLRRTNFRSLVAHELAHQWFYALVGNDQARDPWINEAFATYAQAIIADEQDRYGLEEVPDRLVGDLGRPMSYWAERGGFDRYVRGVYDQCAAVLLAARTEVGPPVFDAAVHGYLQANAHRVVGPGDVRRALRDLPATSELLRRYGVFG